MTQTFNVGSRSLFVTTTAWVFILLGLMASASALVQNAAGSSMPAQVAMAGSGQPLLTGWLLAYLPWVLGAGFVLSVATLAAAVGLLMRLEWARRTFIGLLVLAVLVNLAGLWLQQELMLSLVDATLQSAVMPPQVAGVFGGFVVAARSMAGVMSLAASGLLAWIAWRLTMPAIRQEFA
jgi:hypothetical protein